MVQANWRRDRRPRALPQAVSRAVVTPGVDGRPASPARVRFRGACPWAAATAVSVGTALREGRCSRLVPQAFAPVPPPALGPRGFSRLCFAVHLPHAGLHHLHQKERHGGRLGVRGRSLHHEAHFPLGAARRVPHPEFRLTPWPAGPVSHRRIRRHFSGPLKGQEGTDDGFLSFEISHFNLFPHKLT